MCGAMGARAKLELSKTSYYGKPDRATATRCQKPIGQESMFRTVLDIPVGTMSVRGWGGVLPKIRIVLPKSLPKSVPRVCRTEWLA